MKVLIFGNLASGKSYLANKVIREIPEVEFLAIDEFRRRIGDGTMEKEIEAKQSFLSSIKPEKFQLIEATGLGDTGEALANILKNNKELKFIIVLKTPIEICLERLKKRVWDIPYPAPSTQAFVLAEELNKLIQEKAIQSLWINATNYKIVELQSLSENEFNNLITTLKKLKYELNEANRNY